MKVAVAVAVVLILAAGAGRAAAQEAATRTASRWTDESVNKLLAEKKIPLNLVEMTVGEAVLYMENVTGLNIVVDPDIDATQTLSVKEKAAPAKRVFERIAAEAGGVHEVWKGVVLILKKGVKRKPPPAPKLTADAKEAWDRKISIHFPEAELSDVAKHLSQVSGANFECASNCDPKVFLRFRDVRLGDAVDVICRVYELKIEAKGQANVFKHR